MNSDEKLAEACALMEGVDPNFALWSNTNALSFCSHGHLLSFKQVWLAGYAFAKRQGLALDLNNVPQKEALELVLRTIMYQLNNKKRPAIFATDEEHRTSEHCDAVPWSVIEEVLK